jgi:DNA topoisomerase IB
MKTLRYRHSQIQGNHIHLSFRGKIGIHNKEFQII